METLPITTIDSSAVKKGMSDSVSASIQLQTYTNTVLKTPDIHLSAIVDTDSKSKVVEDLPTHQALARTNALNYLNNINPLIVSTVADIIGFGNLWNAEYSQLLTLAQNISVGNNSATFVVGMNQLIKKTITAEANTKPVIDALNAFLPLITIDERNLVQDNTYVANAIGGETGEIAELQKQIDAYNQAMSTDIAIIAGGATAEIVGALMIVVGVFAEIATAGIATALVVGGIAVVAGGAVAMGVAGADYAKVSGEYMAATTELRNDRQVLVLTKQAASTITALVEAVAAGIAAVESLQKGWNSLNDDFGQVVEALEAADDPTLGTWLVPMLQAANADFTDTLALAKNLQQYGTLPVKSETSSTAAMRLSKVVNRDSGAINSNAKLTNPKSKVGNYTKK